jgi:type IV pilus assembly protein PilA
MKRQTSLEKYHNYMHARKGFTLLEMLLVVALIAILASIVIFAINPGKQLADARNAQRSTDVNTILSAIYQYALDNDGVLPGDIPDGTAADICQTGAPDCTSLVTLTDLTLDEEYLTAIPQDPNGSCGLYSTCYGVYQSTNGRVTVVAPYAERGATISVTR